MALINSKRSDVGLVFLLFLILTLYLFPMESAFAEEVEKPEKPEKAEKPEKLNASFFIGTWKCEAIDQAVNFKWEVDAILGGHWLSGRTTSRGVLQSIDVWKVENHGQPSLRRVFLSDGSFVESLSKRGWRNLKLRSQGLVKEKKRTIQTRETLRWIDEKTFEARMERMVDQKWTPQPKEVCTRL